MLIITTELEYLNTTVMKRTPVLCAGYHSCTYYICWIAWWIVALCKSRKIL